MFFYVPYETLFGLTASFVFGLELSS